MTEGERRRAGRSRTRARIEHAAVDLFGRHGYEAVTVGQLCRAAGVGPATFYRHFPSKEDVLFSYREPFSSALRGAVASAGDAPRRDRLPRILVAFAGFLESQHEVLDLRAELVEGHPALLRRTLAVQQQLEDQLAAALAALAGLPQPDEACDLAAAVGLAVLRAAVCHRREGARPSVPAATRRALVDVQALIGGSPAPG